VAYDLYAVSNHSGTPSGGHYTAAAKNPYTGQWHYFNDQRLVYVLIKFVDGYVIVVCGAFISLCFCVYFCMCHLSQYYKPAWLTDCLVKISDPVDGF